MVFSHTLTLWLSLSSLSFCVKVSVPRPVARISVTTAALAVSLFVIKSFLSTAFFVLVCELFAFSRLFLPV